MLRPTLLTLLIWSSAAMAVEDRIEQTYSAQPGGRLVVDVEDGHVEIAGTDAREVWLEVVREVRAGSQTRERELLARHRVDISQDGGTVRVVARTQGRNWHQGVTYFRARYRINVPADFNIDAKTSDGDMALEGIEGRHKVRTSDGDLRLAGLRGPVDAKTSDGDIEMTGGRGEAALETSDGHIRADGCEGPLTARTSDGDIRITGLTGRLDAKTSDGGIEVAFATQPAHDSRLATSDGDITVRLAADAALDLDCRVSDGSIGSDFAVQGKVGGNALRGRINGGGPELKLRTSDGSIQLRKI